VDCVPVGGLVEINQVVTFGDSWANGAELPDGHESYGEIIAQHYKANFKNYAQNATAIDNMILQLDKFIKTTDSTKNTLALFFLTEKQRAIMWESKKLKQVNVLTEKWYSANMSTEEYENFRANEAIVTLQRMCQQSGIIDYYIMGWVKFPLTLSGIELDKIFEKGQKTCLNLFQIRKNDPTDDPNFIFYDYNYYIKPNVCHPNMLGHQVIADNLISWIEKNEQKKELNE